MIVHISPFIFNLGNGDDDGGERVRTLPPMITNEKQENKKNAIIICLFCNLYILVTI